MNYNKSNNNLIYYFLLFTVLMYVSGTAQNFKKDFELVQHTYSNMNKFSCEIQVKMYATEKSEKPDEVHYSSIKKQKEKFSYSMGTTKMLMNEKCIIYIDEKEKQLIYTILDTKRQYKAPYQDMANQIDSLVKKSDSVVYIANKQNAKEYCIYTSKDIITKTYISIDKLTSLIKKITYYYDIDKSKALAKVAIEYLQINTEPVFDETEFSEKKYVAYSDKLLKPFAPYTHYATSVIDQRTFK